MTDMKCKHDMNVYYQYCRKCGKSLYEIMRDTPEIVAKKEFEVLKNIINGTRYEEDD